MDIQEYSEQSILLSPGPVMLSDVVKRAAVTTVICHREPAFSCLFERTTENLKKIARATNQYQALLLTGSGTAANEAAISSMAALGNMIVFANGEFGERLHHLSKLYNKASRAMHFGWNRPIDLELTERELASGKYSVVAMVHHETSTGMLNPVGEVARIAKKHGCYMFVDAVSSLGAEEMHVSDWDIDIVSCSSGKALAAMPGIGIIIAKHEVLDAMSRTQPVSHYFNLANYYVAAHTKKQTPNTPAVHLIAALDAATRELLDGKRTDVRRRALYFRKLLRKRGIAFFDHKSSASAVLTCVGLPEHVSGAITAKLYEQNIIVYGGKGPLQGKIMQVGHIGSFEPGEYEAAIEKIFNILSLYGIGRAS
jgi:2-aminoethylphosphonate-pyruvate transaminase